MTSLRFHSYTYLGVVETSSSSNRRLKQMVAEQALDIQTLKAIATRNW